MKVKENNIIVEYLENIIRFTYTPTIKRKEEKRVKKAVLLIPAIANNENKFIVKYQDEIIDEFYNNGNNGKIVIDLTSQLQQNFDSDLMDVNLEIHNANSENFLINGDVEILVDCCSKAFSRKKKLEKENEINKKTTSVLDLVSGSFDVTHQDFPGISHQYNSLFEKNIDGENVEVVLKDNGCGNKWKLNLEQYLIKDENEDALLSDGKSSARYIYVDASGYQYEFLDRYYYLENGEKKYIDASEVDVDLDGKLTYLDYEVQQEISSDVEGLSLVTKIENFKGSDLLEVEHEEIEKLKEEIEIISKNLDEYNWQYNANITNRIISDYQSRINDLNDQITTENLVHESYNINIQKLLTLDKTEYIDNYSIYVDKVNDRTYNASNISDEEEKNAKLAVDRNQIAMDRLNVTSMTENTRARDVVNSLNADLQDVNRDYTKMQENLDKSRLDKDMAMIYKEQKYYGDLYAKKTHQLQYLEKRLPSYYLIDENNNILGFAKSDDEKVFRLTFISDNEDNYMYLEYENDKLKKIENKEEKTIDFVYKNDKLTSIKDFNNKKVNFEYENDNLIKIKYSNDRYVRFEYDSSNNLVKIVTQSNKGYKYDYDSNRIVKISKIKDEEEKIENEIEYIDCNSTVLKDNNQVVTYIFDSEGEIITTYENKLNNDDVIGNVNLIMHENRSDNKSLKVSTMNYVNDLLEGINYNEVVANSSEAYVGDGALLGDVELVSIQEDNEDSVMVVNSITSKLEKVINGENLLRLLGAKKFILTGWAKAKSSYINRNINENSNIDEGIELLLNESMDVYKNNRKFELRAEVSYLNNNIVRKEVFSSSFDYLNSNWQYGVVGISISENEDDVLTEIRLIFDYTNNLNEAQFMKMELKEGSWEYKEYNEDKQVIYYKDDLDNETRYEYEDKLLVKETLFKNNKEYVSEYFYNKDNKLKKIEYKFNNLVKEYKYDDKGILIKEYLYYKLDPSLKIYQSEEEVNEYGFKLEEAETVYSDEFNEAYRNDKTVNNYEFDDNGMLIRLTHNDFNYKYSYDGFENLIKIEVENETYLEKEHQQEGKKVITRYINGDEYIVYYNDNDDVIRVEYNKDNITMVLLENIYDSYDNLIETKDLVNGESYSYQYDKHNNVIRKKYEDYENVIIIDYLYNKYNEVIKETIDTNGTIKEIEYSYDDIGNLVSFNLLNGEEENIKYDSLNRLKEINLGNIYKKNYQYLVNEDHTGQLIDKEEYTKDGIINERYEYKYDDKLNIISISVNGEEKTNYEYDNLNRLIKEKNKTLDKCVIYSYDDGGNIIYKKESNYDEENNIIHHYGYGLDANRDRLLSYDNKTFEYDSLGCPLVYKDKNLLWDRKRLINYDNVAFTYNENGIRRSKTYNNVTTKYYYDDKKLKVQDNGNILEFEYDISGVIGFNYNNVGSYYYKKNILGDIVSILDSQCREIVKYEYDGYGNHRCYVLNNNEFVDIEDNVSFTSEGLNNKIIGEINPFRYRSYYYDVETKLYYLLTRYYDPEIARFISIDEIDCLNEREFNGLNLYCYCLNDPINNLDPSGDSSFKWYHWLAIGVGAVLALGAAGVLIAAATGAISGATLATTTLIGAARGILVGAGMGTYLGLGISTIYTGMTQSALRPKDMLIAMGKGAAIGFGVGAVVGGLVGAVNGFLNYVPDKVTGFTDHGWQQLRRRNNGIGVRLPAARDAVLNPIKIQKQMYGLRFKYVGKNATVVLNKLGHIVTTWATTRAGCAHPRIKSILIWLGLSSLFNRKD